MKIALKRAQGYLIGACIAAAPMMLALGGLATGEVRGLWQGPNKIGVSQPNPSPTPSPTNEPGVETFYVSATGDGSAPETTAGAFSVANFNNSSNWTTDVLDDGKIGPGDTVIVLDDGGDLSALIPAGSGLVDQEITIVGEANGSPVVDGAGATANALLISGKSYLIVRAIHFKGGNGATSGVVLLTGSGSDNNVVESCEIGTSTQNGVLFAASAGHNNVIRGNTIHGNTKSGVSSLIHVGSTSLATETLISGNTIYSNTLDGIRVNANYWEVTGNILYSNGSAAATAGIHVYSALVTDDSGDNNIISYNLIHDQTGNGEDGEGILLDRFSGTNQVYYNVAYANAGPCIALNDAAASVLYNNTCNGNMTAGLATEKAEIRLASTATDSTTATVKNNLALATAASTYAIYVDAEVSNNTLDITTNDWYRATGNWYFFNVTPGATLATWNALVSGIGTDLNADPLFTNRYEDTIFSTYSLVGDVFYKAASGSHPNLYMDIYLPPSTDIDTNRCWGIGLFGGNFITGNRKDLWDVADYAKDFAKRGWVFAAIDYTLLRQIDPNASAPASALVAQQDANDALAFMRTHAADYGINPTCAFSMGFSAGGETTSWVGYKYDDSPISLGAPVVEAAWWLDSNLIDPADFVAGDPPWLVERSNDPSNPGRDPPNLAELQAASNALGITNQAYDCVGCTVHTDLVNTAFVSQLAGVGAAFLKNNMASIGTSTQFDLDSGSPCIDAGTVVGLTHDFDGELISGAPDCGAFEGPPGTPPLGYVGGGYNAQGHAHVIGSLGFDTCTVTKNDANAGGDPAQDAGGNPTNDSPACGTAGGLCHGTFRQCVHPSTARNRPRLVNFSVGGDITVHSCDPTFDPAGPHGPPWAVCPAGTLDTILIDQPYLTIDGFSAPSPGITLIQAFHGNGQGNIDDGPANAPLRVTMTHNTIIRGLRFKGHFQPNVDDSEDEVQLFIYDGQSSRQRCSTWDDVALCPTCTVGVCTECGAPENASTLCNGPRNNMLDHNTFTLANDEAGALWRDTDNTTRQHNFWYRNWHPAGCGSNTTIASARRNKNTDYANVSSQNGDRTPKPAKGCFSFDVLQNFVHDWVNNTGDPGDIQGYGFHIDSGSGANSKMNSENNVFLPGRNGNPNGPYWHPDWDCWEGGNPGAAIGPCPDANNPFCDVHQSGNLFSVAHVANACISRPTGQTEYPRDYPLPFLLDVQDVSAGNVVAIDDLIQDAGMPYPTAAEQAVLDAIKVEWLARATRCLTNSKNCQPFAP